MAAIVIRNIPDEVMNSLRKRARANKRSTESEVREILRAASERTAHDRIRIGSELAQIGKSVSGADLTVEREGNSIEPADFS